MNRGRLIGLLLGLAALLAVGGALPPATHAAPQDLVRLGGAFKNFDGFETSVQLSDTVSVFTKDVMVPAGMTALYITISATGETFGEDAVLELRCTVNSVDCNPPGYLPLQNQPGDRENNAVYHTWCKSITPPVNPTPMTVEITMQSSNGNEVALNAAHLFVDASDLAINACHGL